MEIIYLLECTKLHVGRYIPPIPRKVLNYDLKFVVLKVQKSSYGATDHTKQKKSGL